jgi:N-sulfoglucosamine sulfohydrolase
MITPPLSISAIPRLTGVVPVRGWLDPVAEAVVCTVSVMRLILCPIGRQLDIFKQSNPNRVAWHRAGRQVTERARRVRPPEDHHGETPCRTRSVMDPEPRTPRALGDRTVGRRRLLTSAGLLGAAIGVGACTPAADHRQPAPVGTAPTPRRPTTPNILLITADDMDGHTPAAFADTNSARGVTPHIDALAEQGMVFRRAHVAVAVCQPSRSAIMTGLLPHHNGAMGFDSVDGGVELLTDVLRRQGYLNGILGKVRHLTPVRRFGWDLVRDARELGGGRNPVHYRAAVAQFIRQAADHGRPWFLMANTHDPHRPFYGSAEEAERLSPRQRSKDSVPSRTFQPAEVKPPSFLPDLPGVRREYAEYLSSARRCDDVVGAILAELEASGQADNTMIVFLSDNGMSFPFAKANCYLRSTLTPMIIRWPGVTTPGTVEDNAFVSALDLFPTFCDVADAPLPGRLDGHTLTPLLQGSPPQSPRNRVFTVFHHVTPRRPYEMRCVQDARYGYIWNAWVGAEYPYSAENMHGRSWPAMAEAATTDRDLAARLRFYRRRSSEELYDVVADPDCTTNLASRPAHRAALRRRRHIMRAWMNQTRDPLRHTFTASTS